MASIVLGTVGAAIGGYFGGVQGAELGWMLGAGIGSTLDAPKVPTQYGPRLGDLRVMSSAYGTPLPAVYGFPRLSGSLIWSTDKIETATTTGGGKGGPSPPQQVSYTYSQTFAIAICAGPIIAVRKIWANGALIYDVSSSAPVANFTLQIVGGGLQGTTAYAGTTLYYGSATQNPDPTIESYLGVANTPAFRDTAYVVISNFQLAKYGNMLPNFEFEVVTAGSVGFAPASNTNLYPGTVRQGCLTYLDSRGAHVFDWTSNTEVLQHSVVRYDGTTLTMPTVSTATWGVVGQVNSLWIPPGTSDVAGVCLATLSGVLFYNADSRSIKYWNCDGPAPADTFASCYANGDMWWASFVNQDNAVFVYKNGEIVALPIAVNSYCRIYLTANYAYVFAGDTVSGTQRMVKLDRSSLQVVYNVQLPTGWTCTQCCLSQDDNVLYAAAVSTAPLYVWDAVSGITDVILTSTVNSGLSFGGSQIATWFVLNGFICSFWAQNTIGYSPGENVGFWTSPVAPTPANVSAILSDRMAKSGYAPSEYDVSQITDTVDGYICQRGPGRGSIEPLLQAFYIDAVESSGTIKFVKRGSQPIVSIIEDDLAAHQGGTTPPDQFLLTRTQELDLPMEITVAYQDTNADCQTGTQYSRRLITQTLNVSAYQFAIRIGATQARQIADTLLYAAWTERTGFSKLPLPMKYAALEPTDVVNITKGGRTYTLRLVRKDEQHSIHTYDAVLNDVNAWSPTAQGGLSSSLPSASYTAAAQTVPIPTPSMLFLLDIPLLRDQDDGVGFYSAGCGYSSGWGGEQPFKSSDGGATWNIYGTTILTPATVGHALTVLSSFSSGNMFDELNAVSIYMLNGALSSTTELAVLNGANYALLGAELIQFKYATLTAAGVYTLTGLLRGQRGTEWAMVTHAVGDILIILEPGQIGIENAPSSEYGLSRLYSPVSIGMALVDSAQFSFTNTAVAQKCLSPVQLGGGRDAAGNITFNWVRRTRIGGSWSEYADVPLGEAAESYAVTIYTNSARTATKRTLTVSSPTATYTSAMQVTDFGANQAVVYWSVQQISATIGAGYITNGVS